MQPNTDFNDPLGCPFSLGNVRSIQSALPLRRSISCMNYSNP